MGNKFFMVAIRQDSNYIFPLASYIKDWKEANRLFLASIDRFPHKDLEILEVTGDVIFVTKRKWRAIKNEMDL